MAVDRFAALVDPSEFIGRHIWVQNGMEAHVRDVDCGETITVDYYPPGSECEEFSLTYQPFAFFAALEAMQEAGRDWCAQHGSPEEAEEKWGYQPYGSVESELVAVAGLRQLGPSVRALLTKMALANHGGPCSITVPELARALVRCVDADAEATAAEVSERPE